MSTDEEYLTKMLAEKAEKDKLFSTMLKKNTELLNTIIQIRSMVGAEKPAKPWPEDLQMFTRGMIGGLCDRHLMSAKEFYDEQTERGSPEFLRLREELMRVWGEKAP